MQQSPCFWKILPALYIVIVLFKNMKQEWLNVITSLHFVLFML